MEYLISKTEIARRKKAYLNLSLSLITGIFLSSFLFHNPLYILNYVIVAVTMALIGAFSLNFFRNLTKTKILLTDTALQRITKDQIENYPLNKINKVIIKWTTNKTIREVYIWLCDGKSIFISALDHFEQFKNDLLEKIGKGTKVREKHEPLDFDHPLFYSILGLCFGGASNLLLRSLTDVTFQQMRYGSFLLSIYLVALGLYFFITKPISKRSGKTTKSSDMIMAILMVLSGLTTFILMLSK